jgi:Uma2 family endonuclease
MNAAFTPTRVRITVDRYQKMVATGVFTSYDRIELIEGEMLNMAPIGPKHATVADRLARLFMLAVHDAAIVSCGRPLNLGDFSNPQPDVMVLKSRSDDYSVAHPDAADVLLLIEVSDTTLNFDQSTKLSLYARYGVIEYWVVDVEGKRIVVYREPAANGYVSKFEFSAPSAISPKAFPDIEVAVRKIFA